MNPVTNQISFFKVIKQDNNFAIFLDRVAFGGGGFGEVVTIEEIAQLLGN